MFWIQSHVFGLSHWGISLLTCYSPKDKAWHIDISDKNANIEPERMEAEAVAEL